jgi:anaerobic magnesium-protoporphyrin IX monomethyl ester cyclase
MMQQAGCECIAVGIESGSERIQALIKKHVTVEQIREKALMIAGSSRIKIIGYFMIGFPDETEEEILQTINLAASLPLYRANFTLVIPIPGTELFKQALREGKITLQDVNWDTCTSDQISFQRSHISSKRLVQLHRLAYRRFYGRPRIVWQLSKESLTNHQVIWGSIRNLKRLSRRTPADARIPLYIREAGI